MSKYQNLTQAELLDLLIKFTDEYLKLPKEGEEFLQCKSTINEIVTELKITKETDDFKDPIR